MDKMNARLFNKEQAKRRVTRMLSDLKDVSVKKVKDLNTCVILI